MAVIGPPNIALSRPGLQDDVHTASRMVATRCRRGMSRLSLPPPTPRSLRQYDAVMQTSILQYTAANPRCKQGLRQG